MSTTEATTTAETNEYDAAFAEAAAAPASVEPAMPVVEPTIPAKVEPVAAVAEPVVAEEPVAPIAAAPVVATPATAEPTVAELQAKLAEMQSQFDKFSEKPAEVVAPPPPAAPPAPIYTADEEATIAKYKEEWPDIARGEALTRRAEFQELVGYVFSEVYKHYKPLQDYVENMSVDDTYSQLKTLVPDYDAVRDPTIEWVSKQPAGLRAAYDKITEEGSPEDIAELIKLFKAATGYAPAAQSTTTAVPPPVVKPVEVSAAAKSVAAALKVVTTGRTEPASNPDPNDFAGAFAEFAKQK